MWKCIILHEVAYTKIKMLKRYTLIKVNLEAFAPKAHPDIRNFFSGKKLSLKQAFDSQGVQCSFLINICNILKNHVRLPFMSIDISFVRLAGIFRVKHLATGN